MHTNTERGRARGGRWPRGRGVKAKPTRKEPKSHTMERNSPEDGKEEGKVMT